MVDKFDPVSFDDWHAKKMRNPKYRDAYNALEPTFVMIEAMLTMEKKTGMTRGQIAKKMGTSLAALSRMLSGRQPPSWKTIMKFAEATGTVPKLKFESI
jgi:DNA-binding phage protein